MFPSILGKTENDFPSYVELLPAEKQTIFNN